MLVYKLLPSLTMQLRRYLGIVFSLAAAISAVGCSAGSEDFDVPDGVGTSDRGMCTGDPANTGVGDNHGVVGVFVSVWEADPSLPGDSGSRSPFCTGTVLPCGKVLTARHCSKPNETVQFEVGGAVYNVVKMHTHLSVDVAVAVLDAEPTSYLPYASLATSVPVVGEVATAYGAGCTNGNKYDGIVRYAKHRIVDTTGDSARYRYVESTDPTWMDTHFVGPGDSGGPVIRDGVIVAINKSVDGMRCRDELPQYNVKLCEQNDQCDTSCNGWKCEDPPEHGGDADGVLIGPVRQWIVDQLGLCGASEPDPDPAPSPAACGFDTEYGYYLCGIQGADPSGTYSTACPANLEQGAPCEDVTYVGCCDANGDNWYCLDNALVKEFCY